MFKLTTSLNARPWSTRLGAGLVLGLAVLAPACGGGGSAAPAAPTVAPPTNLVYPVPSASYTKGTAIASNTPTVSGGAVTSYSVNPTLPAGLVLHATSGVLSGTPTAVSAAATYTVRATNAGGSATASLSLTVIDVPPAFAYAATNLLYGKDVAIPSLTPVSTGGAVVSWSVAPILPAGLALSPTTGTLSGTPTASAAPQTYLITATNSGGSLGKNLDLTVIGAAPIISTFTGPVSVPMGGSATLAWTLAGDPAATLAVNGASLPIVGSGTATVFPQRRTAYTLTATNLKGTNSSNLLVAARGLDLFAGNVDGPGWLDGTGSAARFNQPRGVGADAAGNLYVADSANHTIRKITPGGVVTTFAGWVGQSGGQDGIPGNFRNPDGLAVDPAGNVFVADSTNNTIRVITPAGSVSTLAGSSGSQGALDGLGAAARFARPSGLALTAAGELIVTDAGNQLIRKVTMAGVVTTLAGGAGLTGSADGTGATARFYGPSGVAAHPDGNVYVADRYNHTLRKVSPAGVVTTLAGAPGFGGVADGTGSAARFYIPQGVTVDATGDLWVSDASHRLRRVTLAGVVTSTAGVESAAGWVDGPAASARFTNPAGLAFLPSGQLAIADEGNHAVRRMDPVQGLSTLAGLPAQIGATDGFAGSARFSAPGSLVMDPAGNAFVADSGNNLIRKVTADGQVTTFAGPAGIVSPNGMARDAAGNLFVVENTNHTLLKITPAGVVSTLAGLAGVTGNADGTGSAARFFYPTKVAIDGAGNLFVTDTGSQTIRKVTPAGVVSTVAGLADASGLLDGNGAAARFNMPAGIAVDGSGNLFVGDMNNNRIRKITPAGAVTTLSLSTFIYGPYELTFSPSGALFVADAWGHAVYAVDVATGTTTLLMGTPFLVGTFPGAFPAGLSSPMGIAFTPQGDLLITTANGIMLATAP